MSEHREDHADRHGFGGPDELDVRTLARGGTPDGSKFLRDDGTWAAASGGTELWTFGGGVLFPTTAPGEFTVTATDGSDIDLDGTSGDLNVSLQRDMNVSADGDVNLSAGGAVNIDSFAGTDVSIGAARDIRMDSSNIDQIALRTNNAAPTNSRINNQTTVLYLDQTNSLLKGRVRYSDGTYHDVEIPVW